MSGEATIPLYREPQRRAFSHCGSTALGTQRGVSDRQHCKLGEVLQGEKKVRNDKIALDKKPVINQSKVSEGASAEVQDFDYLRLLFTRVEKWDAASQANWCCVCSDVATVPTCCGEDGTKAKVLICRPSPIWP